MQKELKRYKEMNSKQAFQKENEFKEKFQEVRDALDRLKSEFPEKFYKVPAVEFELWIWKSIAQCLKDDLKESQALRKELEASLLAQTEVENAIKQEKDRPAHILELKESRIDNLQQQIEFFGKELKTRASEAAVSARMETVISFESEKESFLQTMREKDKMIEDLQKEIGLLEQESLRREFEGVVFSQIGAERTFEHEKKDLMQLVEEKGQRIDVLMQSVKLLEQKFNSSLISFSAELAEKQAEISLVHEAREKIAAAEILAHLKIEERKLMIVELEDKIYSVRQKLESQEKSASHLKQKKKKSDSLPRELVHHLPAGKMDNLH